MRKKLLNQLAIGSLSLCTIGVSPVLAQTPGQQTPSSQAPAQQPSTRPDMTTPGATGGGTGDTGGATTSRKMDDKKFVKDAAIGGLAEVQLGQLAVQKASDSAVKQFGQRMIDDHTKANDQLKEIASKENMEIPTTLDAKHQAMVDKMSKMSGPDFDKAYAKDMLKDHQKDVSEFQNEAQNGSDPNLKQFASSTLPILQEHLTMARQLNQTEKKTSAQ